MKKKAWQKPELIVLIRGRAEEAVLVGCKNGDESQSGDQAGYNVNCRSLTIEYGAMTLCNSFTCTFSNSNGGPCPNTSENMTVAPIDQAFIRCGCNIPDPDTWASCSKCGNSETIEESNARGCVSYDYEAVACSCACCYAVTSS